jgi:O-antigen/teichoic acid export membrane protein
LNIINKDNITNFYEDKNLTYSNIFYQSFNFLWLRAATRLFHELPLILIKRYSGFELVGLIGAIRVFVGYISMPFGIMGNAVMFRILEIKAKNGLKFLWLKLMYFFSISICLVSSIMFLDVNILKRIIGGFEFTNSLLIAFPLLVLSQVGFNIFAPPSDFLGGLKKRNAILSLITILQWPLIIILNNFGFESIIYFYFIVVMNVVVLIAYLIISNISFFGSYKIVIESDFYKRLLFIFILCLISFYLKWNIDFFSGNNFLFFGYLGSIFIYFSFISKERHRFLSELNEF